MTRAAGKQTQSDCKRSTMVKKNRNTQSARQRNCRAPPGRVKKLKEKGREFSQTGSYRRRGGGGREVRSVFESSNLFGRKES